MRDPNELVSFDLTDEELYLLDRGLVEWGGSARMTEPVATVIGFENVADFDRESQRLRAALTARSPMTRTDWTRLLSATEIVFASDVHGSGVEWPTVTGLNDARSLEVLRALQRKLV